MSEISNNLPESPYKKFFGRGESIKQIEEILLDGNTFIASIDGVGGIGKTALAYYFCESILLNNKSTKYGYFDYIVWVTAKETVFDALSENRMIKNVNNNFEGINGLINTTLYVTGFEDLIDKSIEEKTDFFEEEILKKEPIFFILDNLETVNDVEFFNYITRKFNKFSAKNRKLKILTTSRKRKQIADFPIEIEGLSTEDALTMLKYLANEYDIADILKASDYSNLKLLERVGNIPLGIEFIIGQMRQKRTRGEIYAELDGYPSINDELDNIEKKKRISDIILFSYKNMFESLDSKQKDIFKVIAALEKNRHKHDPDISFELLMSIRNYKKNELDESLEILLDNKLIIYNNLNYAISPMAINFVRQFYDDFEKVEDEVIGKKNVIFSGQLKPKDNIDILISNIKPLLNNNEYEECEETLLKALDVSSDYRIFYELAKVQRILNKFSKASDSFRMATKLNQKNVKIWYDWIDMEDNRGRKNIASQIIEDALTSTNYDISIVLLKININKYKKDYDALRTNVEQYLKIYTNENRKADSLKLVRHWKGIEYTILDSRYKNEYFTAVDKLIDIEDDKDIMLQTMREAQKAAKRKRIVSKEKEYKSKIKNLERKILQSMDVRVKKLNQLFNSKDYEKAKKEARKILNWIGSDKQEIENAKNALRVLLQITASEKDYDRILMIFEDYKEIGYLDDNCISIYNKAKKEKLNIELEALIEKISINLQKSEIELRNILISAIGDDNKLYESVISKGKPEWIDQWEITKKKSLKNDLSIIHYSDLSHIRSLMSWHKSSIVDMCNNKFRYHAKEHIKKIIAYLENYITKERNDTFHSRLQFFPKEKLNEVLVDTNRLFQQVTSLRQIMINENL